MLFLAYGPSRSESAPLLIGFGVAFAAYLWTVLKADLTWRHLLYFAIGLRIALLFAPITWTDDHFRYIWDGLCSAHGISPFAFKPDELTLSHPEIYTSSLFDRLNSPSFYTIYPPVAQAVFAFAAWIGNGDVGTSIIALRVFMVTFDIAAIVLLGKLLENAPHRSKHVALYALNPLVLMELSVNVHTEALMIAPCLWAILLFQRGRFDASAIVLALAAATRLWPLLFLAWIPIGLGIPRSIRFIAITLVVFVITWLPFANADLLPHVADSAKLFVSYLEFNGGLFEGLRHLLGNDLVKGTGLLSGLTLACLALYLLRQWKLRTHSWAEAMLWILAIYFFGSQAVHPWYILPLVAFATLTGYRWPILWSLLIVPTYLTYGGEPYRQPYGWVAAEYVILVVVIIVELWGRSQQPRQDSLTSAEPLP